MSNEPNGSQAATDVAPERIAEELAKIEKALHDASTSAERWGQYYAAQQALLWAVNPDLAAAPYAVIADGKVQPPGWKGEG